MVMHCQSAADFEQDYGRIKYYEMVKVFCFDWLIFLEFCFKVNCDQLDDRNTNLITFYYPTVLDYRPPG